MDSKRRRARLKTIYLESKDCQKCSLANTRSNVVFGAGNADTDLMFIGEAPGAKEDMIGRPFQGRSGELLTELLADNGLTRDDVFITNVLMCRPPQNRDPLPPEIEACKPYLLEKLKLVKPAVICTLGKFATQLVLESKASISSLRGQVHRMSAYAVVPTFHPAAALYTPARADTIREDIALAKSLLISKIDSEDLD